MRIGFYAGKIQNEAIGGGSTFQFNIIQGLLNANSDHEFYIYYKNEKNIFKNKDNVKFINLKYEFKEKVRLELTLKSKREKNTLLNATVKRDKVDLVYFITAEYQQVDVPYIYTIWDLAHKSAGFFPEVSLGGVFESRDKFYSEITPKASYIVVGNNEGKRQLCQYYNVEESTVKIIPMITPSTIFSVKEDDSILKRHNLEKDKYVFYPAQFWAHKNHIRLVKMMKKLKEQNRDLKVVFTGSDFGNEVYIKQKVEEWGLENEVLFLGFVSREELISLYKNALALVYASFFGPDNIPPLEAMALRCPVLASGIVGMREQLKDCALFFDPLNENDIIRQLDALKNEELKNKLIQNGEILAKNCSVENYINKMMNLIEEYSLIRECWGA